ncbi:MAG: Uncharacterized protein Athens071416_363 [Parcubacteria group bacterium Athens0714_16]|nr:MAG: Uncharacterized protein Athens071416_363 [Parcubacteria group bacterium Athens0714_16]
MPSSSPIVESVPTSEIISATEPALVPVTTPTSEPLVTDPIVSVPADDTVITQIIGVAENFLTQFERISSIILDTVTGLPKLIVNAILEVKQLIADKIITKTAQIGQLEMIDKVTGEAYCTWIENGEWVKEKGKCGEVSSQSASVISSTTTDTEAPVITLAGNNPAEIIKGTSYIDPGATATDNVTPGIIPDVVWSAHDSALNYATTTRKVMVVDSIAPVPTPVSTSTPATELASTTPVQ